MNTNFLNNLPCLSEIPLVNGKLFLGVILSARIKQREFFCLINGVSKILFQLFSFSHADYLV